MSGADNHGRRSLKARALGAVALLLAGPLALILFMFSSSQHEDVNQNIRQLAVYRAEIAAQPTVASDLKTVHAHIASLPGLIHADSAALAAAQLQSAVKELVAANGGEIRSAQQLPTTRSNGFEIASVEYDLTVPMNRLRALSNAVAAYLPYLFIDKADLMAPTNWDPKSTTVPNLEIHWVVEAYRWARG